MLHFLHFTYFMQSAKLSPIAAFIGRIIIEMLALCCSVNLALVLFNVFGHCEILFW